MTTTIAYFKHGIGNLIMMTPALQAMAALEESKKIDLAMSSPWKDSRRKAFDDIVANLPFINHVVNHPDEEIDEKKYKRWFWTEHCEPSPTLDIFRRHNPNVARLPDWRGSSIHEVYHYMQQAWAMGAGSEIPAQYFPSSTSAIPSRNAGRPIIVLCNGTYDRDMKNAKQWEGFPELSRTLKNYFGGTIVKIGYQQELADTPADIDHVGKLSILETANVIGESDLFITVDTGCMHIGDALSVPMIVVFGGSLISKNGPLSSRACVVRLGLPCQPCQRTGAFTSCPGRNCLSQLDIGRVMRYAINTLR
jgi:ADP-heptose:LPS heptosyltransferase